MVEQLLELAEAWEKRAVAMQHGMPEAPREEQVRAAISETLVNCA